MIDSPRSRLCQRGIFGGTFDPVHYGHLAIAEAALVTQSLTEVIWLPQIFPNHKSATTPVHQRWTMVDLAIEPYPKFRLPTSLESWYQNLNEDLSTPSTPISLSELPDLPELSTLSTLSTPSPVVPSQLITPTPDYAIHQWQALKSLYPHSNWFWILGADSFLTLPRWKGRETLIPACRWLVATRNSLQSKTQSKTQSKIEPLESLESQKLSASLEFQKIQQVVKDIELQGINIAWQILPMPSIDISSTSIRQSRQSLEKSLPASVREYIENHNLYRH